MDSRDEQSTATEKIVLFKLMPVEELEVSQVGLEQPIFDHGVIILNPRFD